MVQRPSRSARFVPRVTAAPTAAGGLADAPPDRGIAGRSVVPGQVRGRRADEASRAQSRAEEASHAVGSAHPTQSARHAEFDVNTRVLPVGYPLVGPTGRPGSPGPPAGSGGVP